MNTPTLEQLRRRPHWSYSSINGFLNICQLQWAFKYVYKEPPLFTPVNLVTGKSFHRAAAYAAGLLKDGSAVAKQDVLSLFSDLLLQETRVAEPAIRFDADEGESVDALIVQGRLLLETWLTSLDPAEKILEVSVPFAVPLEDAEGEELDRPLIGEFDLIVENAGRPVVVDWKTAARRWPESKVRTDLQPTCYLYAYRKLGGRADTRFRFDVVTKTKTPVVDRVETVRDPDRFQRLGETVKVMERMIRQEHFLPAEQSYACGDCPWSMACTGWHRNRCRSLYHLELAA